MDYTEVRFYNDISLNEAIIAWLGENDFDMFEDLFEPSQRDKNNYVCTDLLLQTVKIYS